MRADGVFSGGGIKGLAFAGAVEAAAEGGYDEWVRLAGTSAGAITAMALAVGYSARELRARLDEFEFSKLADYGGPLHVGVVGNYLFRCALTHGRELHDWITQLLEEAPRPARAFGELDGRLRVIGSDIAHARMVVFPEDVALYADAQGDRFVPDDFPIADAVRISAGYPYFFPPIKLRDAQTGRDGLLVDGGVCSAFPIFLFDREHPTHPTWGFRLFGGSAPERPPDHRIRGLFWPAEMLAAVLDTSMNAFDKLEMQQFEQRTISISTGSVPTLEFSLTADQKEQLYKSGYDTARAFFAGHPSGVNTYGAIPPPQAPTAGG